jgi:N-terminal domain of anti-restriction factor ArdC
MQSQKQTTDIPKWSALLVEAVNKPGLIMKAYSAFHSYSLGNQLLALVQCQMRGLQPGPINTFPKWKDLGRHVKRGERALILCMPITCKRRNDTDDDEANGEGTFTSFVYKARWFVLSQTEGQDLERQVTPEWDATRALAVLGIEMIPFDSIDGNSQGFARKRSIAINPVAQLPHKTLFHEMAHLCCLRSYVRLRGQVVGNEAASVFEAHITFSQFWSARLTGCVFLSATSGTIEEK